jgi:hypothetical protein
MTTPLAGLAVALVVAGAACHSDQALVVVNLESAGEPVANVHNLVVSVSTVSDGGRTKVDHRTYPGPDAGVEIGNRPLSLGVLLPSNIGAVTVTVQAFGLGTTEVAAGTSAPVTPRAGAQMTIDVKLQPKANATDGDGGTPDGSTDAGADALTDTVSQDMPADVASPDGSAGSGAAGAGGSAGGGGTAAGGNGGAGGAGGTGGQAGTHGGNGGNGGNGGSIGAAGAGAGGSSGGAGVGGGGAGGGGGVAGAAGAGGTGGAGGGGGVAGAAGAGGTGGAAGSAPPHGQKTEIATGIYFPKLVAVGDRYVFFTDGIVGEIQKIDKLAVGGTPALLLTADAAVDQMIAVGRQLFWREGQRVFSIGDEDTSMQGKTVVSNAENWTIANGKLYWTVRTTSSCTCRYSTSIVSCDTSDIDCSASSCTCTTDDGKLMTAALDGSSAQMIGAATLPRITALAVDGAAAYVTSLVHSISMANCFQSVAVTRIPLNGTARQPLGQIAQVSDEGLWLDASYIYVNGLSSACGSVVTGVLERSVKTGGSFGGVTGLYNSANLIPGKVLNYVQDVNAIYSFDPTQSSAPTLFFGSTTSMAYDGTFIYATDGANGKLVRLVD